MYLLHSLYKKNINILLEKVPPIERIIICEKNVPYTSPCIHTFRKISIRKAGKGKKVIPIRIGRLASPIRRKGKGFGIIYSNAERKRQHAARRAIILV